MLLGCMVVNSYADIVFFFGGGGGVVIVVIVKILNANEFLIR